MVKVNSKKRNIICNHRFNPGIMDGMARCKKCQNIVKVAPAILTVVLLTVLTPHIAMAWDLGGLGSGLGGYTPAYYAGQQDAQYDHDNNLAYNPSPACCHSPDYQDNFQRGYDTIWKNYQSTNQYSSVNINNSPGATVNVGQKSQEDNDWNGGGNSYQPSQPEGWNGCGFCGHWGGGGYGP